MKEKVINVEAYKVGLEGMTKDDLVKRLRKIATDAELIKADPSRMYKKLLKPEYMIVMHSKILTFTFETIKRQLKKQELLSLIRTYISLINTKQGESPKFEMVTINSFTEVK